MHIRYVTKPHHSYLTSDPIWKFRIRKDEEKEKKNTMKSQVKLPGFMQGVRARSRPPSQRWFAEEAGKDGVERRGGKRQKHI